MTCFDLCHILSLPLKVNDLLAFEAKPEDRLFPCTCKDELRQDLDRVDAGALAACGIHKPHSMAARVQHGAAPLTLGCEGRTVLVDGRHQHLVDIDLHISP